MTSGLLYFTIITPLNYKHFINWRDKAVDESSCFFPKDVFENTSAAFHSLHGIPQSPWPNEEQPLLKANAENKSWSPCSLKRETVQGPGGEGMVLKIQLPVPFPKKSVLNVCEQKDYLFTINRIMKSFIQGVPAEPDDFKFIKVKAIDKFLNQLSLVRFINKESK